MPINQVNPNTNDPNVNLLYLGPNNQELDDINDNLDPTMFQFIESNNEYIGDVVQLLVGNTNEVISVNNNSDIRKLILNKPKTLLSSYPPTINDTDPTNFPITIINPDANSNKTSTVKPEANMIYYSPFTEKCPATLKFEEFGGTIEINRNRNQNSPTNTDYYINSTIPIKYRINNGIEQILNTTEITIQDPIADPPCTIIEFYSNEPVYKHKSLSVVLGSITAWLNINCTLNFAACLYRVGGNLQAKQNEMFELKDVANNPFIVGDYSQFKDEYESNPDILLEDMSEFLQGIDKLENLMKELSIDNKQRDPDTKFCCKGNPPPGGKPSC